MAEHDENVLMPMKMKLFETNANFKIDQKSLDELEVRVAEWFKENASIKVVDIKQSASGGGAGPMQLIVSVWYEPAA
jgi:hypothetical protein